MGELICKLFKLAKPTNLLKQNTVVAEYVLRSTPPNPKKVPLLAQFEPE